MQNILGISFLHKDPNLIYYPAEIFDVGCDSQTKLPKALIIASDSSPSPITWAYTGVTVPGTTSLGSPLPSYSEGLAASSYRQGTLRVAFQWSGLLANTFLSVAPGITNPNHCTALRNSAVIEFDVSGTVTDLWVSNYAIKASKVYNKINSLAINSSGDTVGTGLIYRNQSAGEAIGPHTLYLSGLTLTAGNNIGVDYLKPYSASPSYPPNDYNTYQFLVQGDAVTGNTYGVASALPGRGVIYTGVKCDKFDQYYWGGHSTEPFPVGSTTLNPTASHYFQGLVYKTTSQLVPVWVNNITMPGRAILVKDLTPDTLNNPNTYVISDIGAGTITFTPTWINPVVSDYNSVLIHKLDNEGRTKWASLVSTPDGAVNGTKIIVSDAVYVAGSFSGKLSAINGTGDAFGAISPNNTNIFLLKLDLNGNFLPFNLAGPEANVYPILTIGSIGVTDTVMDLKLGGDYLYLLGQFDGTTQVGSFTLVSNGNTQSYVAKIDKNTGAILSVKSLMASDTLLALTLDLDAENIYVSGTIKGQVIMAGNNYNILSNPDTAFFVWNLKNNM